MIYVFLFNFCFITSLGLARSSRLCAVGKINSTLVISTSHNQKMNEKNTSHCCLFFFLGGGGIQIGCLRRVLIPSCVVIPTLRKASSPHGPCVLCCLQASAGVATANQLTAAPQPRCHLTPGHFSLGTPWTEEGEEKEKQTMRTLTTNLR